MEDRGIRRRTAGILPAVSGASCPRFDFAEVEDVAPCLPCEGGTASRLPPGRRRYLHKLYPSNTATPMGCTTIQKKPRSWLATRYNVRRSPWSAEAPLQLSKAGEKLPHSKGAPSADRKPRL